jgi:dienelactone hydrolase
VVGRIFAGLVILLGYGASRAQTPEPFAVPKIDFEKWQELSSDDETIEFSASYPSAFKSDFAKNDVVAMRVLLPRDVPKPKIVVILHYWGAPDLRVERSLAIELNNQGIGAAIMTLPYHLSRTPLGKVSGAMAITSDPNRMEATMTQAVMDVRRGMDFIEKQPICGDLLGIYGTSLGAIVSSLSYAVDPRIKNAVFLLGGVDLASIIWNSSKVVGIKDELKTNGWSLEKLRERLVSVEPSTYLPKKSPGKTLIVRAQYDTVIPPNSTDQLIKLLPKSSIITLDTGHYGGIFVQGRLLRETANFFHAVADERSYNPPQKIIAPTIRIGLLATTPSAFDVAIGLDVFKFDKRGDRYASLLLTPRSPVLWIGSNISTSLNFGVGISTGRTGIGVFWSTVL